MITARAIPQPIAPIFPRSMDIGFQDFEKLKAKARIPLMSGVAANVLVVLQERLGRNSMGIKEVAKSIDVSKRTLQRHLKAQMVSYASLRDRVRFNRAIGCLLVDNMSIEATSKYLDFSDRTSFTNAFKRWAGLSPSVFRKLYRDYA
ncbi:MAG: AraC-like DNA-binding protein [Candidatus Endobugula sp.]|jgi:AraC-like DNA-binding protein